MFPFFESICIQDKIPNLLNFHQLRINQTFETFYKNSIPHNLNAIIELQKFKTNTKLKLKFYYSNINFKIELHEYYPIIYQKFKLINLNSIHYPFKYTDRDVFQYYSNKSPIDETQIFIKNNEITDATHHNIAFRRNKLWITPTSCLLRGCMRQFLIESKKLTEERITISNLNQFQEFKLINALNSLNDAITYDIQVLT